MVNEPTVVSRLSRYSYGMSFSHYYDPYTHLLVDRYFDEAEGVYMAKHQMTWVLKRVRKK